RDPADPMCALKSTSYLRNLLARRNARGTGADEAVFLNLHGELAEGSASNLFLLSRGVIRTPPPDAGILPGVMRSVVLDRAVDAGLRPESVPLTPADLENSDGAFLTNAIIGIVTLTSLDGRRIGS